MKIFTILLLLQVTTLGEDDGDEDTVEGSADGLLEDLQGSGSGSGSGIGAEELLEGIGSGEEDGEEEDAIELVHVNENFFYMAHVMRLMAFLHSMTSLAMLIAYYHLKVIILTV